MRGRGQRIFEMVGAIINLLFITNKRNTTFLQEPVIFVFRLIILKFSSFWGI